MAKTVGESGKSPNIRRVPGYITKTPRGYGGHPTIEQARFVPSVKLDPRQVQDRRNSPVDAGPSRPRTAAALQKIVRDEHQARVDARAIRAEQARQQADRHTRVDPKTGWFRKSRYSSYGVSVDEHHGHGK